jgi:cobaltochelatase CobS
MSIAATATSADSIICQIDGENVHVIASHITKTYSADQWTIERYREEFPDAPLYSPWALLKKEEMTQKKEAQAKIVAAPASADQADNSFVVERRPFHEVFSIPASVKGAMNGQGKPIACAVFKTTGELTDFVPELDPHYIFDIDNLKRVLMGLDVGMNVYTFGHAGTGKSTLFEQICAHTGRPMMRVQHTVNMEECHVLGQYIVMNGSTVWEDGPLPYAMRNGLTYLADEYDFAMPHVSSLYQPVLEGKALMIKEAPKHMRVVKPHPNFRFVATGNTNGSGDETGLYQGTSIQNFANYERFGIMMKIGWMPKKQEASVIAGQAGILIEDANSLVDFATAVRKENDAGKISAPISPRALINAGRIARMTRSFQMGVELAFLNRLSSIEAEACRQVAARFFPT